jgi:hypothetical protein
LLGIVFKKRRANLSDVAKERVKTVMSLCFEGRGRESAKILLDTLGLPDGGRGRG